ncbi:protein shisa-2-like [Branchiostoma floridae x Branchiostoma japonicum]
MTALVFLVLIAVLGTAFSEDCSDYTDVFGVYHYGFTCPRYSDGDDYSDTYCCGPRDLPYCCDSCLLSQNADFSCDYIYLEHARRHHRSKRSDQSNAIMAFIGMAIGGLVFIAIIIALCYYGCRACYRACCQSDPPREYCGLL